MLRLACTADALSEEKKESEDRTSRVPDVEKGPAVGMMVVGRRGPRLCGNSEQESEGQGQGQLCSTHTTAAGIVTPNLKAKRANAVFIHQENEGYHLCTTTECSRRRRATSE
jgi:hypothetical protein